MKPTIEQGTPTSRTDETAYQEYRQGCQLRGDARVLSKEEFETVRLTMLKLENSPDDALKAAALPVLERLGILGHDDRPDD